MCVSGNSDDINRTIRGFPDGAVVFSPGLGGPHIPQGDWAQEPQLLSPAPEMALGNRRHHPSARPERHSWRGAPARELEKGPHGKEDSAQPKINKLKNKTIRNLHKTAKHYHYSNLISSMSQHTETTTEFTTTDSKRQKIPVVLWSQWVFPRVLVIEGGCHLNKQSQK